MWAQPRMWALATRMSEGWGDEVRQGRLWLPGQNSDLIGHWEAPEGFEQESAMARILKEGLSGGGIQKPEILFNNPF